jgi:hypothetical protein
MYFVTTFFAVDNTDGQIKQFVSDWYLLASSWKEAQHLVETKYPYLVLQGVFEKEVDYDTKKVLNVAPDLN